MIKVRRNFRDKTQYRKRVEKDRKKEAKKTGDYKEK